MFSRVIDAVYPAAAMRESGVEPFQPPCCRKLLQAMSWLWFCAAALSLSLRVSTGSGGLLAARAALISVTSALGMSELPPVTQVIVESPGPVAPLEPEGVGA